MEEILPTDSMVVIDENVPLGRSKLWDFQRRFYEKNQIDVWDKRKVPFYITSNPCIADSYATIIARFIQDCKNAGSLNSALPFYVVELGTGHGVFSFHILDRLFELKKLLCSDVQIVYVMTDLVQTNIDFWRSHESFQPYIASGQLDFAHFDAERSSELVLLNSGTILHCENDHEQKNPVVLIANYVFDSLRQDVFLVNDGVISEGLCRLTTNESNVNNGQVGNLNQVDVSLSFSEVQLPYYHIDFLNELLVHYQNNANGQYVSLPVGSLVCIEKFRKMANNQLLLLSSDKGYAKYMELYQKEAPAIVFHDNCFSLSVNFNSIAHYFRSLGGDSFTQNKEQSLITCAFISGFKFEHLPETSLVLETYLNSLGHSTVNQLFLTYNQSQSTISMGSMLSLLEASKWDTWVFNEFRDSIVKQMKSGYATMPDIQYLKDQLIEIERNFYRMPNAIDTPVDIGIFLQETGSYKEALEFYEKSVSYFGEKDSTLYNMGLCYYFLLEPEKALEKFSKAVERNPTYVMARGWISQIESERGHMEKG